MKFRMSENSLFAILLRSSWWYSLGLGVLVSMTLRLVVPEQYSIAATLSGAPFLVIAAMGAWRQLRAPSATRIASILEAADTMSWRDFAAALEDALVRDGYTVKRLNGAADFEIVKEGRTSLVGAKRWKAASTGLEPLRDLHQAAEAREAASAIYVVIGGITANARQYAAKHLVRIIEGADLAQLLRASIKAPSAK